MTEIIIVTDKVARTLVERHGSAAIVHVEEQVKVALKRADWVAVKSWRHVGHEIEKLRRFPMKS